MTIHTVTRREKRLPSWLRRNIPLLNECTRIESVVNKLRLHTICREGLCPNRSECYAKGKVTFMVLGDVCTRGCRFCSVAKGTPRRPDRDEPMRITRGVRKLGLSHVIVTSVTRDDLPDGGSAHFAAVVRALREVTPPPIIEVLVPDFGGSRDALETVAAAGPDIISHNMETVRSLYGEVRRGADYDRSLRLLHEVKSIRKEVMTKSSFMLGLGETMDEMMEALMDLRRVDCDFVALGQYLRPGMDQLPVQEYIPPERFAWLEREAFRMGFREATAGPLVRSSYGENRLDTPHTGGAPPTGA